MRYQIRRAHAADWSAIVIVHEKSIRFEPHFIDDAKRPRIAALKHVFRGDLWVADAGRALVGFVAFAGCEISWLYVDPDHFRKGIGRALLRQAIALCGPIANITVLSENSACLALLASEGFIATRTDAITIRGHGEVEALTAHRVGPFRAEADA